MSGPLYSGGQHSLDYPSSFLRSGAYRPFIWRVTENDYTKGARRKVKRLVQTLVEEVNFYRAQLKSQHKIS